MIPGIANDPFALCCAFVVLHALADYPLQGEYLARQKVRRSSTTRADWLVALAAHSAIHAGGVWLVSGSLALGLVEFVLHGLIDIGKGEGRYGLLADQGLHLACKAGYAAVLAAGLV